MKIKANTYLARFTLILFGLAGCYNKDQPAEMQAGHMDNQPKTRALKKQQALAFLNFYTPTDTFPITISTKVGEWEGPDSERFKWRGTAIPAQFWPVFDSFVAFDRFALADLFFGTKRFRVNKTTWALLTRVPGAFWSSQIYVFLFDMTTYKITQGFRLAEAWADTGDSFYLEAVVDKTQESEFVLNLKQAECHPQDENYVHFTCTDSLQIVRLKNQVFEPLAKAAVKK